ncbi:MAG: hypothetical protein ACM31C_27655 [Acidobacteriota bacterium]
MRSLALLGLCACNEIFGLSGTKTRGIDAQYFDAPADAPYTCPPAGVQPGFDRLLHQVIEQDCFGYTISTLSGVAVATCYDPGTQIESGLIDQPMTPVVLQTKFPAGYWYNAVFTPDHDMFVTAYDMAATAYSFVSFVRGGDGTWTDGPAITWPFVWASGDTLTVPSHAPGRHMLYFRQPDNAWYEIAETAPSTWALARAMPYKAADLGVAYVYELQMSGDGLRLIGYGEPTGATSYSIVYASRPRLDADWPPLQPLATAPGGATTPFLTDDCSRLYFSGLSSVLYVQQQ